MKRRSSWPKAGAAFALVLVLAGQPGAITVAGGQPVHSVTQFSQGSEEATFYFTGHAGVSSAAIVLPRNAYVTSAQLDVRGLPGPDGTYPTDAQLGIGSSGDPLWSFGERQAGAGQMGRQQGFSDGSDAADLRFPSGGGTESSTGLLIPDGAIIRSASIQLVGGEGPHGSPIIFGARTGLTLPAWDVPTGRALIAGLLNSTLTISELDPSTSEQLRYRELRLGPDEPGHLADFQYSSDKDTAAIMLPGSGIYLLALGTQETLRFYDDARASSLTAMRYGGGWLAAAGTGWASVIELPSGVHHDFNSSSVPGALAGKPVAVDYDPEGARLFSACDRSSGKALFSVIGTASGNFSHFEADGLPASVSAMRYLPGSEQLLYGLAGKGTGGGAGPVMVLELAGGTSRPYPLFSEGEMVQDIELCDGQAASLVSAGEFVTVDLRNDSYDVHPVAFPDQSMVRAWSFDFQGRRLLAVTSSGELYILDFKSGRGHPLQPPGAAPAGISAVAAGGSTIFLGTQAGVVAMSKGGTLRWHLDCGMVGALSIDEGSNILVAGASEDWSLDPSLGAWGFSNLNLTVVDIQAGPSSAQSWAVPLGKGAGRSTVPAMALDSAGGRLFFGVSSGDEGGGLLRLNISTGAVENIDTQAPASLALSRDTRTLYAGSEGDGLLVIDLPTGARRALNTYNGSGLLSPHVSSLMVDGFGRLLAGQADHGRYGGGLTVFGPDMASSRSYPAGSSQGGGGIDVRSIARDPKTMRVFLGLGNGGGLVVIDENANTQLGVPRLFDGLDGAAITLDDLSWDPDDGTLLCAGSGLGFGLHWAGEYLQNVGLDIGADGTVDWSAPGKMESAYIPDIVAAVQGAVAAAGSGPALKMIPLRLSSTSAGLLGLRSLAVTYDWSRHIDITDAVRSTLASREPTGNGIVTLFLKAQGGGLSLFNLSVTYLDDSAPSAKAIPALTADTIARAPTIVDLGRYFTDELSAGNELTYTVRPSKSPAGVEISLLFSRYLLIDSRGSTYRGHITVNVTATDSSGLSTSKEVQVNVARSDEYIPPQPAYTTFLWVSAAILAGVGCWILILYIRVRRAKKD